MLIITNEIRAQIKKVVDFAEANPFTYEDLMYRMMNPSDAPGLMDSHTCLFKGYRVAFSIEEQAQFKARHISITLNEDVPPPTSVLLIIQEFGFKVPLNGCHVYMEELSNGGGAINIIEPIL